MNGATRAPTAAESHQEGCDHWKARDFERAYEAFRRAAVAAPHDPGHWSNVGLCLRDMGQPERAVQVLQTATRMNPHFAGAWNELANTLQDLGREEEALPMYDRTLELDPTRAVHFHNKAVCLTRLGRLDEAEQCLDRALEIDPSYSHSLEERALLSVRRAEGHTHGADSAEVRRARESLRHAVAGASVEIVSRAPEVVALPTVISASACKELVASIDGAPVQWPRTSRRSGSGYEVDLERRRVLRAELPPALATSVRERFRAVAPALASHFGVSITGVESPQFLRYEEGHFFTYHQDVRPGAVGKGTRAITMVLALNATGDPEIGFRGGTLRLFSSENDAIQGASAVDVEYEAGRLVAFRSSDFHDVTQIQRGRRYVVVSWLLL